MQAPNYYQILSVPEDAPRALIKKRFVELAKETHPDLHHGKRVEGVANVAFGQLQKAYKVLNDPDKRRAYDVELGIAARPAPPDAPAPRGPSGLPWRPAEPPEPSPLQAWFSRCAEAWPSPAERRRALRGFKKQYRQFSQRRPVVVARPFVVVGGVFLTACALPRCVLAFAEGAGREAPPARAAAKEPP